MDQTSKYYIEHWDMYWQSYLENNPDLLSAGINDKRKTQNHYLKRGINENRIVVKNVPAIQHTIVQPIQTQIIESGKNNFVLNDSIFKV